jgi:ribonuclease H / adenosylcobalamin/alpha-ribazole phosphatase
VARARRLKVIVEADGGARGNPGPAGWGTVVREAATGETLVERGASIGIATNNVAEYSGLIAGLKAAADLGAVEVEVRMDSKLVVEQMSGRWQIKHPGLRPLAAEAAGLVGRFESVRFSWVPREENRRADALANAAMDGKTLPETDLMAPAPEPGALRAAPSWSPSATGPATRLVLVRHGETALTAQRRFSGRGDVPLSDAGRGQAAATGTRLSTVLRDATVVKGAAAVVTSPLSRCVETAEAIATALGGVPVRREPDLIECDFGEWEGLTFAEVRERWPEQLEAWLSSPAVAPPGGESFDAVLARVRSVRTRLLAEYPAQTVVLVSHVTPIKLILKDALAAGDAFLHRLYLDPAGVSLVDSWADGGVAVRTVNDTSHLGDVG